MFAVESLQSALTSLDVKIHERLIKKPPSEDIELIRYPIGLFFLRGDRAGFGAELAKQVVASYNFWHIESGEYFDMVFPGWVMDAGTAVYIQDMFIRCKNEFAKISKWTYSGESDILLLNYDYAIEWHGRFINGKGQFNFDETIVLPLESMLNDGKISSLDAFMQRIINLCKDNAYRSDDSVLLEIRDKVAMPKGRDAVFAAIRQQFMKGYAKVYDELRPYAVCNLSL